jgi:hypothetical protein
MSETARLRAHGALRSGTPLRDDGHPEGAAVGAALVVDRAYGEFPRSTGRPGHGCIGGPVPT